MDKTLFQNIDFSTVLTLKELVPYGEKKVNSISLAQKPQVTVSLLSFDKGEGLSTHSAPGDAMILILEGSVNVTIGDDIKLFLKEGETTVMPANIPHGLEAAEKFKMLLVLVKPTKKEKEELDNCGCGCS